VVEIISSMRLILSSRRVVAIEGDEGIKQNPAGWRDAGSLRVDRLKGG
jgi:hypothetical protein